jgi:hypothetical protein
MPLGKMTSFIYSIHLPSGGPSAFTGTTVLPSLTRQNSIIDLLSPWYLLWEPKIILTFAEAFYDKKFTPHHPPKPTHRGL